MPFLCGLVPFDGLLGNLVQFRIAYVSLADIVVNSDLISKLAYDYDYDYYYYY